MQWSHMNRRRRGTRETASCGRRPERLRPSGWSRRRQRSWPESVWEILGNARNELYLSMRFLDVALSSLYFAPDPSVRGLGTDGTTLFFQMESLAAMYKKNRILVNRTLPPRSGSTVCSAICGTGKSGTGSTGTWPVTLRRSR